MYCRYSLLIVLSLRLLPCPVKEGADSDGAALVQGALQGVAAVREGEAAGPCVHREHPPGEARGGGDQGLRGAICINVKHFQSSKKNKNAQNNKVLRGGTFEAQDKLHKFLCFVRVCS